MCALLGGNTSLLSSGLANLLELLVASDEYQSVPFDCDLDRVFRDDIIWFCLFDVRVRRYLQHTADGRPLLRGRANSRPHPQSVQSHHGMLAPARAGGVPGMGPFQPDAGVRALEPACWYARAPEVQTRGAFDFDVQRNEFCGCA